VRGASGMVTTLPPLRVTPKSMPALGTKGLDAWQRAAGQHRVDQPGARSGAEGDTAAGFRVHGHDQQPLAGPLADRELGGGHAPVPYFMIVLPGWFFNLATSAATSPVIAAAFQVVSSRLAEATNLGRRLIMSRYGSPVTCDQAAANFSYVTRPSKNASTSASWACAWCLFSASQYGSAHSSGEPTTPSSDTSVASTSFLIPSLLLVPVARRTGARTAP
jgi:hypothetical protein